MALLSIEELVQLIPSAADMPVMLLAALLDTSEQAVALYLDREIEQTERAQTFTDARAVLLKAYPVASVAHIVDANGDPLTDYALDSERGIIRFHAPMSGAVTYTGGFAIVPQPVKTACALMCGATLASLDSGGREVSSETFDDYSVRYSTPLSNALSGAGAPSLTGLAPAAAALLALYRSSERMG